MRPVLILRHGRRNLPLTEGAVSIGRLAECDVVLEGGDISRRHARIVATPEGPLLVDRSRFGTWLNGAQVVAPSLLQAGDEILVGPYDFQVELGEASLPLNRGGGWRRQLALWRKRYGLAELFGTVALVAVALLVQRLTGLLPLAALAGSLAEGAWFYGVLLGREYRVEQDHARKGGFVPRPLRELAHDLLLEFGSAERVDGLLLRPLCLGLGLAWIGGWVGLLAGKVAADLIFYGPVLTVLHWRDANRSAMRAAAADPRRRETTASLPVLPG